MSSSPDPIHDFSGKVGHIYCSRLIDYEAADHCSRCIDHGIRYIFLIDGALKKEGYGERVQALLAKKGKHCSLTAHYRREYSKDAGWTLSNTYLTVLKPEET